MAALPIMLASPSGSRCRPCAGTLQGQRPGQSKSAIIAIAIQRNQVAKVPVKLLQFLMLRTPARSLPAHAVARIGEAAIGVLADCSASSSSRHHCSIAGAAIAEHGVAINENIDGVDVDAEALSMAGGNVRVNSRARARGRAAASRLSYQRWKLCIDSGDGVEQLQGIGQLADAPEAGRRLLEPVMPGEERD